MHQRSHQVIHNRQFVHETNAPLLQNFNVVINPSARQQLLLFGYNNHANKCELHKYSIKKNLFKKISKYDLNSSNTYDHSASNEGTMTNKLLDSKYVLEHLQSPTIIPGIEPNTIFIIANFIKQANTNLSKQSSASNKKVVQFFGIFDTKHMNFCVKKFYPYENGGCRIVIPGSRLILYQNWLFISGGIENINSNGIETSYKCYIYFISKETKWSPVLIDTIILRKYYCFHAFLIYKTTVDDNMEYTSVANNINDEEKSGVVKLDLLLFGGCDDYFLESFSMLNVELLSLDTKKLMKYKKLKSKSKSNKGNINYNESGTGYKATINVNYIKTRIKYTIWDESKTMGLFKYAKENIDANYTRQNFIPIKNIQKLYGFAYYYFQSRYLIIFGGINTNVESNIDVDNDHDDTNNSRKNIRRSKRRLTSVYDTNGDKARALNSIFYFDFKYLEWHVANVFLPNKSYTLVHSVVDSIKYKNVIYIMAQRNLKEKSKHINNENNNKRKSSRSVKQKNFFWKLNLFPRVSWKIERQIWIGFHKNARNKCCLIDKLPKDIVTTIVKLLSFCLFDVYVNVTKIKH